MKKIITMMAILLASTIAHANYQVVIDPKGHLSPNDITFSKTETTTPPVEPEPEPEPFPPKDEDREGYTCQPYSETSNYGITFNTDVTYPTGTIRYVKWSNSIIIDSIYTPRKNFPYVAGQYTYVLGDFKRADTRYNYYVICRYPNQP